MVKENISFKDTGLFSQLMVDYVTQQEKLQPFYNHFPSEDQFIAQTRIKKESYNNRKVLCDSLLSQYANSKIHSKVLENLQALQDENTFTITTGHQLNLFTGPLYFVYKILCVIRMCEELNQKQTEFRYVPVYWMATEDHDFEEINHFNYEGKVIHWHTDQKGAVGRFTLENIKPIFDTFKSLLPNSHKKEVLLQWFQEAYLQSSTLSEATRKLVNILFEEYGLIIVDGDDVRLKELFRPYVSAELLQQESYQKISKTNAELEKLGYKIQVNPREINLFYLKDNLRERIVKTDNQYVVNNTSLVFSEEEILQELNNHPDRFSPNVMLRPLYQEVILPNVAYVGGGGEIAYWLQLKTFFESQHIAFPILKLRNSALIIEENLLPQIASLGLEIKDIFHSENELFTKLVRQNTELELSLHAYQNRINEELENLQSVAVKTDVTFEKSLQAQKRKWEKTFEILEKKLLKAEKKKQEYQREKIKNIAEKIHPHGKIQERYANLSEMIIKTQLDFIQQVKNNMNPFEDEFIILGF